MSEQANVRGFTFFLDYYTAIAQSGIPLEEQAKAYNAICAYVFFGEEPKRDGVGSLVVELVRSSLDKSITNARNRRKKGEKTTEEENEKETETNGKETETNGKETETNGAFDCDSFSFHVDSTSREELRTKNLELRTKIDNFVDVNRTPLYPPKGSGAGEESVENEGEEAYFGGERGEEYGNIDDYPVSTEEPPEIDYDHMTPYQQFVFDWNIRNDVDNYDAGSVANIDWAAMYDEVERSPSFLQKRTARGLKFFIGISDKILRGDYRDDNNLTTAEEIYARSGRQQKKAFRHIQRKNDLLRSDPWKEQAN